MILYAGHDTLSGVKVSNEPVRRNQIVEDKFTSVRMWMKEVQDEVWRTRTGSYEDSPCLLQEMRIHFNSLDSDETADQ